MIYMLILTVLQFCKEWLFVQSRSQVIFARRLAQAGEDVLCLKRNRCRGSDQRTSVDCPGQSESSAPENKWFHRPRSSLREASLPAHVAALAPGPSRMNSQPRWPNRTGFDTPV